jgi:hypothetical protein
MKKLTIFLLLTTVWLQSRSVYSQVPIHDRAVVAQQERMVFKQWDQAQFHPLPRRVLGVPTNPNWYLVWAFHPDYPKLDRRPLSSQGEQTQRLGLAAAMKISSDHFHKETDTVKNLSLKEITRISAAFSDADPLYRLYYKKELDPLEIHGYGLLTDLSPEVHAYLQQHGVYQAYLEHMQSLAERYRFAKTLDMERGQRILMYHRIMLDMRRILDRWAYQAGLAEKVLTYRRQQAPPAFNFSSQTPSTDEELAAKVLQQRTPLP